jgi:hypothetical protein
MVVIFVGKINRVRFMLELMSLMRWSFTDVQLDDPIRDSIVNGTFLVLFLLILRQLSHDSSLKASDNHK